MDIDFNDIIGNRYGHLVVDECLGNLVKIRKNEYDYLYLCHCVNCGNQDVYVSRHSLIDNEMLSCGCCLSENLLNDLKGQYFNRWHVLNYAPYRYSKTGKSRRMMWMCQCSCGTYSEVGSRALLTGMSESCGCLQKERVSYALTDDLTNKEFGFLKVKYRNGSRRPSNRNSGVRAVWHCECRCGNEIDTTGELLKSGDVTSCGCSKESKYEYYVEQYLCSLGYVKDADYFREKAFDNLVGLGGGNLLFDFYVHLHSGEFVLIECQGEQHYRPFAWYGGQDYFNRLTAHDAIKRDFSDKNNIRLIYVDYKCVTYDKVADVLLKNNVI